MEQYPDEEETDSVKLDGQRGRPWRVFAEIMIEVWMIRRHCYMIRGGMSALMKSKNLLSLGICWKFSGYHGKKFI